MHRGNYIAGLRAIADFYENNPAIHIPIAEKDERADISNYFCNSEEEIAVVARALKPFNKVYPEKDTDSSMWLEKEMAPGVFLRFHISRVRICKQVTKTIPAHMVEVPEQTVTAWECNESLLAGTAPTEIIADGTTTTNTPGSGDGI